MSDNEDFSNVDSGNSHPSTGSLDLSGDALGRTGLAGIASAVYRNTYIDGLEVSANGLDDLRSAIALRELLRRNGTITRLFIESDTL
jgi:hypothetical protein